jgi:hypothetical protein
LSCREHAATEVPFAATRNSYWNRKSIYQNWTSVSRNKIILDTREHDSVRTCDDWRTCFCTTQFLLPSLLCSVSFVKRNAIILAFPNKESEFGWLIAWEGETSAALGLQIMVCVDDSCTIDNLKE